MLPVPMIAGTERRQGDPAGLQVVRGGGRVERDLEEPRTRGCQLSDKIKQPCPGRDAAQDDDQALLPHEVGDVGSS
jgi:hypothetical protein